MAKLKTLPKALIVGTIIAAVGFLIVKFMPAKVPATDSPPPVTETPLDKSPQPATEAPSAAPPATEEAQTQPSNVTNGSAGLNSVLKAGKK